MPDAIETFEFHEITFTLMIAETENGVFQFVRLQAGENIIDATVEQAVQLFSLLLQFLTAAGIIEQTPNNNGLFGPRKGVILPN